MGGIRRFATTASLLAAAASVLALALFLGSEVLLDDPVIHARSTADLRLDLEGIEAERDLAIERIAVRAISNGRLFGTQDHYLFVSDDFGETFVRKGVFPKLDPGLLERVRDRVARHPAVRRIRGLPGPMNVVVLHSGTVLVFYDRIYRSPDGGERFIPLVTPVDSLYGPAPLHAVAVDPEDRVFYGEYLTGERPNTVRIVRGTEDGTRWEICHTFGPGEVYHVHSVSWDPWGGRLLVATGDRDEESGIWELDPECSGVRLVSGGEQRWRIIAPLFTDAFVLWGSDDDQAGSDIWRKRRGTKELEHLHRIGSPSYDATRLLDGSFVVSTTYEPDSRFTSAFDPEPASELWFSRDAENWHRLDHFVWVEEIHGWGRARARALLPWSDGSSPYLFVVPDSTEDGFVTYRYRVEALPASGASHTTAEAENGQREGASRPAP